MKITDFRMNMYLFVHLYNLAFDLILAVFFSAVISGKGEFLSLAVVAFVVIVLSRFVFWVRRYLFEIFFCQLHSVSDVEETVERSLVNENFPKPLKAYDNPDDYFKDVGANEELSPKVRIRASTYYVANEISLQFRMNMFVAYMVRKAQLKAIKSYAAYAKS